MVQDTSLEAYIELRESGRLRERQQQVYDAFKEFPTSTDKEISEHCGLPINVVTARRNELNELGWIVLIGKRKCTITGNNAMCWSVIDNPIKCERPKTKLINIKMGTKIADDLHIYYGTSKLSNIISLKMIVVFDEPETRAENLRFMKDSGLV